MAMSQVKYIPIQFEDLPSQAFKANQHTRMFIDEVFVSMTLDDVPEEWTIVFKPIGPAPRWPMSHAQKWRRVGNHIARTS